MRQPFPAMSETVRLVVFRLDELRIALALEVVERIVRAVEVTPLPRAPAMVLGAIQVAGEVLPVLNLRRRFKLPNSGITPAQHFVITRIPGRRVVLIFDESFGVTEVPAEHIRTGAQVIPGLELLRGIVALDEGLVLIDDLEKFLTPDEESALDEALKEESVHGS
jgi:purine-binding chemotaxis protein CheW